jgi:predicted RNA-binding protein YlqC (UPF0109 family)
MHNITFSFPSWVWQHLPSRIRRLGENSIIGRFAKALCTPISEILIPVAKDLQDAIYEKNRRNAELDSTGVLYRTERNKGESDDDYLLRIQKKKIINRDGNTIKAVKSIIMMVLGVEAEISQENDLVRFIVGQTVLGSATCAESSYYRFVFRIYLPDLSGQNVNHDDIRKYIDEYSPNNEFRIFERRDTGLYEW